jgi:nucleotide-binding universal stress UspA family protein
MEENGGEWAHRTPLRLWEGIVDVADELYAAVIVIGSRGLSGLKEILEGSLSHQLAEHAGRPVLVVPPHDSR